MIKLMHDAPRLSRFLLVALMAVQNLSSQSPARLIVLDPGHFHASLLQKEMYPELHPQVSVYAPLGPELLDYLNRISLFNNRPVNPTTWQLDIHTAADSFGAMLRDKAGDLVVFSGKNRAKIGRVLDSLSAGLHVLADKPWIIDASQMPQLEQALDRASQKGLAAYDIMTERYEVTSQLQRVLVNLPAVFGRQVPGDAENPGVKAFSVHHIMKTVAGLPLRRPTWFFDVEEYGEGLADVGTHPVDLIQWTLFPDQVLDYKQDIKMLSGKREAVPITKAQFEQVTGAKEFPASLAEQTQNGVLHYYCNNYIAYTLRGVHVKLDVLWKWEAAPGTGDVYEAIFRGTKANVELRQRATEHSIPELYVVPVAAHRAEVFAALDRAVAGLQSRWPGLRASHNEKEARIEIPAVFRVGHEDHFAQVARHFFSYMKDATTMPAWERGYMLAKYFVTTKGVELGRQHNP
ncbi:putative oxidoreductase C-terminal domain-containing protein [Bryobacter aggregatus]|uniref:putative oxidoreductase C-terminal domain-containing protein n=1 Tax=Bryobacter aggregatus TaxID=360054 RepID=UPI0006922960|nr:putative oxidoreductase C-terminal domain-containing protein [Bryobacter aggregatus]